MKTLKHLRSPFTAMLAGLFFSATTSFAQDYQKTFHDPGKNTVQNSVLEMPNNDIITAGTVTDPSLEFTDIEIKRIDINGNVLWRKIIDITEYDHCYGLAATKDEGFVITGSTYNRDNRQQDILVMRFDDQGNILYQNAIRPTLGGEVRYSQGLDIIQRETGKFILVGFSLNQDYDQFPTAIKTGYIFELEDNLTIVGARIYNNSVLNNIIKVPGRIGSDDVSHFISGTIFEDSREFALGVLIGGGIDTQWARRIDIDDQVGRSHGANAVYDPATERIYYMFNEASAPAKLAIAEIDKHSGNVQKIMINSNLNPSVNNIAGLSILLNPSNSQLIVAGFMSTFSVPLSHNNMTYFNRPLVVFEVNKTNGQINWENGYKTLAKDYVLNDYSRTKGVFSVRPIAAGLYYFPIYAPTIATITPAEELVLLDYSNQDYTNTDKYDLTIIKSQSIGRNNNCEFPLTLSNLTSVPFEIKYISPDNFSDYEEIAIHANSNNEAISLFDCIDYECGVSNFTSTLNPNSCKAFTFSGSLTGSNSATSWNWDFGGGVTYNTQTVNHSFTGSGTFSVTLIVNSLTPNNYPCTQVITKNIVVNCGAPDRIAKPGTSLNGSEFNVQVYPNPSQGIFTITAPASDYTMEITDLTGRVILKQKAISASSQIDLGKTAKGMYLVKVTNQGNTSTSRIVVE